MNTITLLPTRCPLMFRALLVFCGHDPAGFAVKEESGMALVQAPGKTVAYPQAAWVAHFGRDLYQGVYGPGSAGSQTPD
jgi:hypothetical protein